MQNSYTLTPKQYEYIANANARWNFKIGAVRSGKSFVDVVHVIPSRLMERRNEKGLSVIIGVTRDTIERNVLQPMREMYTDEIVGMINSRNIARICGQDVYCLGAEKTSQVSKILGSSIKYCYGDEIAKWNKDVFSVLQSRLDKPYSCFDGACNPENPMHWLKAFIDRDDINKYVQSYTIFDNPYLPAPFVEALQREYKGTVYEQRYIFGEWALAEGLIYPMYAEAIADVPKWKEDEPRKYSMSIDYGTLNAFAAILWEYHGGVWYGSRGYYYSGRDTGKKKTDEEYAQDLDACFEYVFKYYEKRGGLEKLETIIDPSAASFITLLQKRGKYKVRRADNDVLDGIRETASAMKNGAFKISPTLEEWKDEAGGYAWDNTEETERPIKVNDHYMDATRYFIKTKRVAIPKNQYSPLWMR